MAYGRTYRTAGYKRARRDRLRRKYGISSYRNVRLTVPRVRKLIMNTAEQKSFSGTIGGVSVDSTWTFLHFLTGIVQGTTTSTRIGSKIFVQKITVNLMVYPGTGDNIGQEGDLARFIMVHQKQTNGITSSGLDVFQTNSIFSVRNHDRLGVYNILRDRKIAHYVTSSALSTSSVSGSTTSYVNAYFSNGTRMITFVIKPKKVIEYTSNATTVSALLKDSYFLGFCASVGSGVSMEGNFQVEFTDF